MAWEEIMELFCEYHEPTRLCLIYGRSLRKDRLHQAIIDKALEHFRPLANEETLVSHRKDDLKILCFLVVSLPPKLETAPEEFVRVAQLSHSK